MVNDLSSRRDKCGHASAHAKLHADKVSAKQLVEDFEVKHADDIQCVIEEFSDIGRKQSATFAFWLRFIEGSDLLLRMLRAECSVDFEMHLKIHRKTWYGEK